MIYSLLAVVHALAAAAWFGSMFYSFSVLQPRAKKYFANDAEFEAFIATISQGARWKVLGAFGLVALSGLGLVFVTYPVRPHSSWLPIVFAKALLFVIALGVFCHTSWRLWPRRVMAAPSEVPEIQRAFRWVAMTMISLVGASAALGVLAHTL